MQGGRRKIPKSVTLDEELIKAMDTVREHEPLSSFINRTLRVALGLSEE
jgi:hypothetical protein